MSPTARFKAVVMKRSQDSVTNGVKPPQGQGVQRRCAVGSVLERGGRDMSPLERSNLGLPLIQTEFYVS
ncbi:hypothetical protein BHE90_015459 [Fusarium euwallaceae]|uniref:Uncharacterized protein n=1 Tax=Fusarium euwallaceae TaxID=1147111 RepID=A0A430L362_9HYPO|nr:hypothetical protein BHE90_015459 [Fusarium euwallaceae]